MYNPEEDVIPPELIEQALAISLHPVSYKVYFDKETGNILAITNEPANYANSIDVEFEVVRDFIVGKKQKTDYKILFVGQSTPVIISKADTDVNLVELQEVFRVYHWDSMFTIENYPQQGQWGFQLREDQRIALQSHNLNTQFEIFIVDKNNSNLLLRNIKLPLQQLINVDRVYVAYQYTRESDITNRIFVRKFFSTIGYQILNDTNC